MTHRNNHTVIIHSFFKSHNTALLFWSAKPVILFGNVHGIHAKRQLVHRQRPESLAYAPVRYPALPCGGRLTKNDCFVAVQQNPVFKMVAQASGKNSFFNVFA